MLKNLESWLLNNPQMDIRKYSLRQICEAYYYPQWPDDKTFKDFCAVWNVLTANGWYDSRQLLGL